MPRRTGSIIHGLLFTVLLLLPGEGVFSTAAQDVNFDRDIGRHMLRAVKRKIEKNYYDPTLHGLDWDQRYQQAEQRIRQARSSYEVAWRIYDFVRGLNDSHTFYRPPRFTEWYEYGFEVTFYGEALYVAEVEEGGAAEKAGLQVGDRIVGLRIGGTPARISGSREMRSSEELLLRYVGFPYWDILVYPIRALSDVGELDKIEVIRMSPDDVGLLEPRGASNKLEGTSVGHFGAFFKRSFRENDYLWGRLDAAERLIGMLASSGGSNLYKEAFTAIIEDERKYLKKIRKTLDNLKGQADRLT